MLDINDESPRFTLDMPSLSRNTLVNGSAVVTVEAADRDAGENGTVEYSFLEDSNGGMLTPSNSTAQTINRTDLFRIDSNLGNIFLVGRTSVPAGDFKLTVVATDLGIPERRTSTALVLICVTRAPPPPLGFPTTKFFIAEKGPVGTVVGTVTLQTSSGADINPANYTNNLQFSG